MKRKRQSTAPSRPTDFVTYDSKSRHNVSLESRDPAKGFGGWVLYPTGFKMAADEIINHLDEDASAPHLAHFMAYPIAFLYRHYLELRLKQILWTAHAPTIPETHDLMMLWGQVREAFKNFHPQDQPYRKDYQSVIELLRPFDDIDPRSVGFRYPYDANQMAISIDIKWINLHGLKAHVSELADLFDRLWPS
jgi:hypothetical protein